MLVSWRITQKGHVSILDPFQASRSYQPAQFVWSTWTSWVVKNEQNSENSTELATILIGFLRWVEPRGGGITEGFRDIPREDWGTLGKIRGITTPPKQNPIAILQAMPTKIKVTNGFESL